MLRRQRGFTLTEALVSVVVLLIGIVSIMQVFPASLRANSEAALRGRAVLLAQAKAEEVRRDTSAARPLLDEIRALATPTTPVLFPNDDRLTYSFSGTSVLYPTVEPGVPESAPNVARVIVRINDQTRPGGTVLYELRFGS